MSRLRSLLLLVMVALLVLPSSALAHDSVDAARREANRLEQAQARARKHVARIEDRADRAVRRIEKIQDYITRTEKRLAKAEERLDRIQPRLDAAATALADAEEESARAEERAERARARAERAEAELEASLQKLQVNEDKRASVARDAYMYGPAASSPAVAALQMADGTSPNEMADILHMLDVLLLDHGMLVDESVRLAEESRRLADEAATAQHEREVEADLAAEARDRAAVRHAEMSELLNEAEAAYAEQQEAAATLARRQEQANQELAALERARANAQDQVAQLGKAAQDAADRAEELARQAAAAAAAAAAARAAAPSTVASRPLSGGLATVGGITVSQSIAGQLAALLNAARADGIVLGGHGYRSPATTVRLRRANGCPDVYTSPPSSCRVPTARPGTSMHEKGLAIDFTYQGRTICFPYPPSRCYGNPGFDWLRANAARYGLYGLSSEAWHFSTNGR